MKYILDYISNRVFRREYEEYIFPSYTARRRTLVTKLPAGASLPPINDLKYFNNKLLKGLHDKGFLSRYIKTKR